MNASSLNKDLPKGFSVLATQHYETRIFRGNTINGINLVIHANHKEHISYSYIKFAERDQHNLAKFSGKNILYLMTIIKQEGITSAGNPHVSYSCTTFGVLKCDEKPYDLNSEAFLLPMPNILAQRNGKVCTQTALGSYRFKTAKEAIENAINHFWSEPFQCCDQYGAIDLTEEYPDHLKDFYTVVPEPGNDAKLFDMSDENGHLFITKDKETASYNSVSDIYLKRITKLIDNGESLATIDRYINRHKNKESVKSIKEWIKLILRKRL